MRTTKAPEAAETRIAIHILFEEDLLKEIENYRFDNRYTTRVEAIKALIRAGLASPIKKVSRK